MVALAQNAFVGGTQPALTWNVLLVLLAVMLAAMQGVLVIESAEPCRISYGKWKLLLLLQALEVAAVALAEIFAFVGLSSAVRVRLTWLHWVAPTLLLVGLIALVLDVWFALKMGVRSRLHWIPFSSIGQHKERPLLRLVPLLLTAVLSLVLIGWRQRWWLTAVAVDAATSRAAAARTSAISNGVLGLCMAWCLFLYTGALCFIIFKETMLVVEGYPSLFHELLGSRAPGRFLERHPSSYGMPRDPTTEHLETYELSYQLEHGLCPEFSEEEKKRNLAVAPLHVGNAVVGPDRRAVYDGSGESRLRYLIVLVIEHFSMLPLVICALAAVVGMHDKLDEPTYRALAEFVNMIIVLALVEIAVGLKTYLWGLGYTEEVHKNDRTADEPDSDPDEIDRQPVTPSTERSNDGRRSIERFELEIGIDD